MVLQKGGPDARKRGGHFFCPKNLATPKKKVITFNRVYDPYFRTKAKTEGPPSCCYYVEIKLYFA